MSVSLLAAVVVTGALAIISLGVLAILRLRAYRGSEAPLEVRPGNRVLSFSMQRYQPMAMLLTDDDLLFLAAQPGYRPKMGKNFRRERRRIFRMYLRELAGDFHRLHAAA